MRTLIPHVEPPPAPTPAPAALPPPPGSGFAELLTRTAQSEGQPAQRRADERAAPDADAACLPGPCADQATATAPQPAAAESPAPLPAPTLFGTVAASLAATGASAEPATTSAPATDGSAPSGPAPVVIDVLGPSPSGPAPAGAAAGPIPGAPAAIPSSGGGHDTGATGIGLPSPEPPAAAPSGPQLPTATGSPPAPMTGALGPATTGDPGGRDDIGATVDASGGVPFATGASPTGDARQDADHRGDEPLLPGAPPADRAAAATTAAAQGRTGDAAPAPPGAADSAIAPAPTSTLANAAAPRGDTDLTPSPAALGAAAGSPAAAAAITPAAPPVTVAATGATTLAHAPRALAATIDLAVRGGISRARLRLSPEHLGGIEVRLRSGPNGIEAQLVADSQQAAGTLTAAAAELADRLRSHGIELARLDVRCGADGDSAARDSGADAARQQPASGHGTEAGDSAPAAITTLTLLDGVLVDVLA